MNNAQLMEVHQQMFFQFGRHDFYHFGNIREIVIVKYDGNILNKNDVLKIFKY